MFFGVLMENEKIGVLRGDNQQSKKDKYGMVLNQNFSVGFRFAIPENLCMQIFLELIIKVAPQFKFEW